MAIWIISFFKLPITKQCIAICGQLSISDTEVMAIWNFSFFKLPITKQCIVICGQLSICFVHRFSHNLYFLEEHMFSLFQICCGENTPILSWVWLKTMCHSSAKRKCLIMCIKTYWELSRNDVTNSHGSVKNRKFHIAMTFSFWVRFRFYSFLALIKKTTWQ